MHGLLAHFDWEARSRLVEDIAGHLLGAVLVTGRETTEGTVARVDPAADGDGSAQAMRDLVTWSLQLSRAAGAAAAQVWVGPGHGDVLRAIGLDTVRPWWRMDRGMTGALPTPAPVPGYELVDGLGISRAFSWADVHNRSFADHWSFLNAARAS